MRDKIVWDFAANQLKTTFTDTEVAPNLQKIDNEGLNGLIGDNAIHDKRAHGVWRQGNFFFDIRLTNTNTRLQNHSRVNAILKKNQKTKNKK